MEFSPKAQLVTVLFVMVGLMVVWAQIDRIVMTRSDVSPTFYPVPFPLIGTINYPVYWFWMWLIQVPIVSLLMAMSYYAGAPDTMHHLKMTIALFATGLLLSFAQLEDFFYFALNNWRFPAGTWGWFQDNTFYWKVFGTWNTNLHFMWLGLWMAIIVLAWVLILGYVDLD